MSGAINCHPCRGNARGGEGLYAIESALVRGMCSYFHWLPRILDFKYVVLMHDLKPFGVESC